jgi:hypothetical protein
MSARALGLLGLVAGGGALAWWLTQQDNGAGPGVYSPIDLGYPGTGQDPFTFDFVWPWTDPASTPASSAPGSSFLAALSRAEDPSQDPYAKNPYSSASGLFQITKDSWTRLGGDWGTDPTKAFGGLHPTVEEQWAMAQKLTNGNASVLSLAGLAVNNATLYAAHILGAGTKAGKVAKVATADPSTPLASVLGASTVAKNPALGQTVQSFWDFVNRKVG